MMVMTMIDPPKSAAVIKHVADQMGYDFTPEQIAACAAWSDGMAKDMREWREREMLDMLKDMKS